MSARKESWHDEPAQKLKTANARQIGLLFAQGWSRRRMARELGLDRERVSRRLGEAPTDSKPAKARIGFQARARTELSAQPEQQEASLDGRPHLIAARPDDPEELAVAGRMKTLGPAEVRAIEARETSPSEAKRVLGFSEYLYVPRANE